MALPSTNFVGTVIIGGPLDTISSRNFGWEGEGVGGGWHEG